LDPIWYFVISLLSLVLILETLETVRLKRALEKLGNTVEALRAENEGLRKRLEGMKAIIEELSKSAGLTLSNPEAVATGNSETADIEDHELRRRVLELRVVNLYRQGVPVKEIVKQTGLSRATVYRILRKYRAA